MPRKNTPPPGTKSIVNAIKDLIKLFGGKSSFIGKALGINPSYAGKIVKNIQSGKSASAWIGLTKTKRGEKNLNRFQKLIKKSKVIQRESRTDGKLKKYTLPPEPKRKSKKAEIIKSHKFIKDKKTGKRVIGKRGYKSVLVGDSKKTVYKFDPSKRIPIPKNADIQLEAKGIGISPKKKTKITMIHSHVGDWATAWNSLRENIERTHFSVHDIHVIVIQKAPIKQSRKKVIQ
jgi:hypothetical protein